MNPPRTTVWQQTTSTNGRRWALGLGAGALALLLLLGIGVAGALVLRSHDRVDLFGNRQERQSFNQDGAGNGRGPGNGNGNGNGRGRGNGRGPGTDDNQNRRALPGVPGDRAPGFGGLGGLGSLLGGSALHGEVTANANGSVQALVFQRGEVTAVSDTSVTLKSSDGFVGTYSRTAATISRGAALVKGGQGVVLARASDKVALTTIALRADAAPAPSS